MKNAFLIMMVLTFASCASTGENFIKQENPKLYNADCLIKEQQYSEANVMLTEESSASYKVRASDGKVLALPTKDCILSQVPTEDTFSEDLPGQYWTKCRLGKMSLVTDGLIFVDDSKKNYIRFRRRDGQIWLLPRTYCSIYPFKK